jgi:hypothetical protein
MSEKEVYEGTALYDWEDSRLMDVNGQTVCGVWTIFGRDNEYKRLRITIEVIE